VVAIAGLAARRRRFGRLIWVPADDLIGWRLSESRSSRPAGLIKINDKSAGWWYFLKIKKNETPMTQLFDATVFDSAIGVAVPIRRVQLQQRLASRKPR
jgi:hypothetical protein